MQNLTKFISYFIAFGLFLKTCLEILVENANGADYILPQSVVIGGVILIIVGFSLFFSRTIWKYLFLFGILASFSSKVDFSAMTISFSMGIEIDLIALMLLILHLAFNLSDLKVPSLSESELNHITTSSVSYYVNKYRKKTHEELKKISQEQLNPEAKEALAIVLKRK